MFTTEAVLTIVAVISLLITAAGAIGGSYWVSRSSAATRVTKEIAEAWEEKAAQQEDEIKDLQEENRKKDDRIQDLGQQVAELKAQVGDLQDLIRGRAAFESLSADHDAMKVQMAEVISQVAAARLDIKAISAGK